MPKATKALKNYHAVALGQKGGIVGGPARARALSADQRIAIAKKGARAAAKKAHDKN